MKYIYANLENSGTLYLLDHVKLNDIAYNKRYMGHMTQRSNTIQL